MWGAMAMVALWGCSGDEDSVDYSATDGSEGVAIAVIATVEDATTETRTAYSSTNLPQDFGLFVANSNSTTYSYDNIKWSYSDGSWTADDSKEYLWQGMSQTVGLVAYAPYDSDITSSNKTSISISVDATQTEEKDALLLWQNSSFTPSKDLNSDKKVEIKFWHALTKLTIDLVLNSELLQKDMWNTTEEGTITSPFAGTTNPISKDSMTISGFKTSGTYGLTATTVGITVSGSATDIKPYVPTDSTYKAPTTDSEGHAYYQCMVLPQTITSGEMGVTFYVYGQQFHWTSEKDYTFNANTAYTLKLEVREKVVSVSDITAVAWTNADAVEIDAKNSN